jgi:hypothetical protein
MTTYKSYKDLHSKTLENNDTIVFVAGGRKLRYHVRNSYLNSCEGNDYIFRILSIDKRPFCRRHYKYNPKPGTTFPSCNNYDYEALTKVTLALLKRCDNYVPVVLYKENGKEYI